MDALTKEEMVQRIQNAGVIGAGGGGFPTHEKLKISAEVIIANGAECEPLARVDQQRMAREPEKVIRGLQIAMQVTGARRGVIALKEKYHRAIDLVGEAIRHLGLKSQIEIQRLRDFYPAGDEFVLVREALGKVIPEFGLPPSVGAVVCNVSTLADVADAVDLLLPVTHREVTVTGEVQDPMTLRVPIGTPISSLVEAAGGARDPSARILIGGPMMGILAKNNDLPVTKTLSLLVVLPEKHPVVQRRTRQMQRQLHLTRSACLKCMLCSEICPRNLLGHRLYPDRLMRNLAAGVSEDLGAFTGAYLCSECGLCAVYACVMGLDPCAMNHEMKQRLQAAGVPRPKPLANLSQRRFAGLRQVPSKRLVARLGLSAYDREAIFLKREIHYPRLVIPLKQHAGKPARAIVKAGQMIKAGQRLAEMETGTLGANLHAPKSGRVVEITQEAVILDVE